MSSNTVIVTPYYKEDEAILRRCIESVKAQTVKADHILVADGHPQEWVGTEGVRHISLDRSHGDYGNTPRSIGCALAIAAGYQAISLLDADCWLEPDHVEHCLAQAASVGPECGFVAAHRHMRRPEGPILPFRPAHPQIFIDTNCYFLLPPAFETLAVWHLMPKELSVVGDRVYHKALFARQLPYATSSRITVNYTYTFADGYRELGEPYPEGVKEPPDFAGVKAWIRSLPEAQIDLLRRTLRCELTDLLPWIK